MTDARRISLFLAIGLLLGACGKAPVFDQYHQMHNSWHKDSVISFTVAITDTSAPYGINVKLRHNAQYPFSNLYVFRKIESASGVEYQDTANFELADPSGKWLGHGVGELKTVVRRYRKEAVWFSTPGKYTFTLQQGMRVDALPGVEEIGLEVLKLDEENQ